MTKDELVKIIDDYLKPEGFSRKDKTWYKDSSDTILIFAIDKSQYSNLYYASVHFLLKEISDEKFPKFWKSHSYFRAEGYMKDAPEKYLDLENELDDETRKIKITNLLDNSISVLNLFESKEGIKKALTLYNPRSLGIKVSAQNALNITIE